MPDLLAVAHDAGGSEIVSCWIKKNWRLPVKFLLDGPAIKIFQRNLGSSVDMISLDEFLANPRAFTLVITGTSWAVDLEKLVHRACATAKVKCIAYLDHWIGYSERFTLNGQQTLPNEIWVGDSYAESIAKKHFPGNKIKYVSNAYIEKEVTEIQSLQETKAAKTNGTNILYCTEPTSIVAEKQTGNPEAFGYTEFSAIESAIAFLKVNTAEVNEFRVRPHPSEYQDKYNSIIEKYAHDLNIMLSTPKSVAQDCAWADIIIGCDSMVMAIAIFAGKRVMCAIPAEGKPPTIPLRGIERMFVS